MTHDLAWARAQDAADPLLRLRDELLFPPGPYGGRALYFAGHSLGLQPRRAREYVNAELDDWALHAVEGHFKARRPWLAYHELLTPPTARLVGAREREVVVMNTLTVNLHLLLVSFYRPTPARHRILVEASAFPSDRYAVASQARFHGFDPAEAIVALAPRAGEDTLRDEDIVAAIDEHRDSLALVLLGQPNYLTGQAFDVPRLVRAAHAHDIPLGLDLAHGAGNLRLQLHDWDVDFACWCNYKYLNAGPGGLGGIFVHERHARAELPRLSGWWGHDKATRFRMGPDFEPLPGAEGWQLSNPPILQLAALRASMELFDAAGMEALRARGDRLTAFLEEAAAGVPGLTLVTPREPARRGSMLTFRVAGDAQALAARLAGAGAIADARAPDILRLAPTPLAGSFEDVSFLATLLHQEAARG